MVTAAAKDRIRGLRAAAEAAGKRLPRQLRPVPRQAYPIGLEYEYTRALRREVAAWGADVTAALDRALPRLVAQAAATRRVDDAGDRLDEVVPGGAGGWAAELDRLMATLVTAWGERALRLRRTVAAIARRIADFNYVEVNAQFRAVLGVDVLGAEPWLADELTAFGKENARLIKHIGEQAADRVERVVAEGVRSGAATRDIKNQVKNELGITDRRARLIARDQVGKANGNMTRIRQQNAGVTQYRWRGVLDRRERPAHRAREGQVYSWDSPPPDGNPGQPVQCRCHAEPVLDEFADLLPARRLPDWEAIGNRPRERRRWGKEYDAESAREMDADRAARRAAGRRDR